MTHDLPVSEPSDAEPDSGKRADVSAGRRQSGFIAGSESHGGESALEARISGVALEETVVDPRPFRIRELLAVVVIAALADITCFRATGFAGGAAFLLLTPCLLLLGSPAPRVSVVLGWLAVLIGMTSARMIWQGSLLVGLAGFLALTAFAMALAGRTPDVLDVLAYTFQSWISACDALGSYQKWSWHRIRHLRKIVSWQWMLPTIAVLVFGSIFIAANPSLVDSFSQFASRFFSEITNWLAEIQSSPLEVLFVIAVAWYVIGALRPTLFRDRNQPTEDAWETVQPAPPPDDLKGASPQSDTPFGFPEIRNTLIAVSALFAVYLVFEFQTLWFRTFPTGFHYSGYAHRGAAWLTVALALATAILSLIFRGALLQDRRLPILKFWTWIWSAENFLLGLAVYNRLWIYIGFNGMTRMRTVALVGITSVMVGFLLVLWKIARNRGFLWLLRNQMLTVALAGYVYLLLPVDWLVYRYNVNRILAGDVAPVVQITEHPVSPEGVLTLFPLLASQNVVIRDGIRAFLEEQKLAEPKSPNQRPGWTGYQIVYDRLTQRLSAIVPADVSPAGKRSIDWSTLRAYAYQWY